MSCGPIVIGDTPETQINYGETIDLVLTYKDQAGPMDLTGSTVSIISSAPTSIKADAVVSVLDAEAGKVRLLLHRDDSKKLRMGRNNWFRLQAIFGENSDDITPEIYLQVS